MIRVACNIALGIYLFPDFISSLPLRSMSHYILRIGGNNNGAVRKPRANDRPFGMKTRWNDFLQCTKIPEQDLAPLKCILIDRYIDVKYVVSAKKSIPKRMLSAVATLEFQKFFDRTEEGRQKKRRIDVRGTAKEGKAKKLNSSRGCRARGRASGRPPLASSGVMQWFDTG
jgi:hypothetical protein